MIIGTILTTSSPVQHWNCVRLWHLLQPQACFKENDYSCGTDYLQQHPRHWCVKEFLKMITLWVSPIPQAASKKDRAHLYGLASFQQTTIVTRFDDAKLARHFSVKKSRLLLLQIKEDGGNFGTRFGQRTHSLFIILSFFVVSVCPIYNRPSQISVHGIDSHGEILSLKAWPNYNRPWDDFLHAFSAYSRAKAGYPDSK